MLPIILQLAGPLNKAFDSYFTNGEPNAERTQCLFQTAY